MKNLRRVVYSIGKLVFLLWGTWCTWSQVFHDFTGTPTSLSVHLTVLLFVGYTMAGFVADQVSTAFTKLFSPHRTRAVPVYRKVTARVSESDGTETTTLECGHQVSVTRHRISSMPCTECDEG